MGGRPSSIFRLSTPSTSTQPPKTRDSEGFVDVDSVDAPETQPDDDEWGELKAMRLFTELVADLARLGIRLEAHGNRLRYSPRSAVTPDLADRMKTHKGELLAILRPEAGAAIASDDDQRTDDSEAGRAEVIDPPGPCPKCGRLELWETLAGDWRCLRCDPPTTARRLRTRAVRLKSDRTESPRIDERPDR